VTDEIKLFHERNNKTNQTTPLKQTIDPGTPKASNVTPSPVVEPPDAADKDKDEDKATKEGDEAASPSEKAKPEDDLSTITSSPTKLLSPPTKKGETDLDSALDDDNIESFINFDKKEDKTDDDTSQSTKETTKKDPAAPKGMQDVHKRNFLVSFALFLHTS
jgi:hypothetical protein